MKFSGSAPVAKESPVDVAAWWQRIYSAQKLAEAEKPVWDRLEDGVDGIYPVLIDQQELDDLYSQSSPYHGRFKSGDQLDVNLLGRVKNKKVEDSYDQLPSVKFTKAPSKDRDVVKSMETLAEKLLDEGEAVVEEKRGMELSLTRGQYVVWPMFRRNTITETEIVAGKTNPAEYVMSVHQRNEPYVPLGADYDAIAKACSVFLEPRTPEGMDNPKFYALTEAQKIDLTLLSIKAQKAATRTRTGPHPIQPRAEIYYECTPYLSWCLVDPSVTDFSKVGWIARKIVQTPAEFQNDPAWTEEAKKEVPLQPRPKEDGGTPTAPDVNERPVNGTVADQQGRVTIWQIWDRIGWRVIYLADGYAKAIGKSTRYPYMDAFGRPLFPDFFPCVWRTPWSRMRETAARVLGRPGLEDMWAPTIEAIKALSGFIIGCKSTARVFLVAPGISQASITKVARAQDATFVQFDDAKPPPVGTDMTKQFSQLEMSQVPIDYLDAYDRAKREAFEAAGMSYATMTATPQAETATGESLIQQGAAGTQGAFTACFEDAHAELAWKSLLMFLEFCNEQQLESYLGAEALEPRKPIEAPQEDPATGQMIPAPMRPSIYQAMMQTDLIGERLQARFASSTRQENAQRIKMLQDSLAMVDKVRDATGTPYRDPGDVLDTLLKESDVEAGPYRPTEMEIAMRLAAMQGGKPQGGAPEKKDDHDTRKAGGERGTPDVPGRHSRHQQPPGTAQSNGVELRRAHSVNQ